MKIDEDLIYEQLENLRDEIWTHIRNPNATFEQIDYLVSIVVKLNEIVAICKTEQEVRDDEYYAENDDRIAKFDF